jgi:hypothetical protein
MPDDQVLQNLVVFCLFLLSLVFIYAVAVTENEPGLFELAGAPLPSCYPWQCFVA